MLPVGFSNRVRMFRPAIYKDFFDGPPIRSFNYCKLIKYDNSWIFEMVEFTKDKKWKTADRFVINGYRTNK